MSKAAMALQKAILENRVSGSTADKGQDAKYFIRSAINTLAGGKEILNPSVVKAIGITNFNNATISKRNLSVSSMRVAYSANASVVGAVYTNVIADAAVYNGEIRVTQDGKTLFSGPVSGFHSAGSATQPAEGFLELDLPFIIEADKPVTVYVETPAAAAATANIEVVFAGVENATR